MKINHNLSAVITNNQLKRIEQNLAASTERLSTGYKINKPGDSPAGLAISHRMQTQIDAINQASDNTSAGISVMQIADGALNEVSSVLQRMRELSVQAASDSNTPEDKKAIQAEIQNLKSEVDRISTDTEYNTKNLLDGSADQKSYAYQYDASGNRIASTQTDRLYVSDAVEVGTYKYEIKEAAQKANIGLALDPQMASQDTSAIGVDGSIDINGSSVEIKADMTVAEAYEAFRNAAEIGEAVINPDTQKLESVEYGTAHQLSITCSSPDVATKFFSGTFNPVDASDPTGNVVFESYEDDLTAGKNVSIELDTTGIKGFDVNATVYTDGNRVTVTDISGFKIELLNSAAANEKIEIDVTDIGKMKLQVGGNQYQEIAVRIPEISTKSLYIDNLNVVTVNGGGYAISALDKAIEKVSSTRSGIGAAQNRLIHAQNSLEESDENMTGAFSTLMDTDMAEEMTKYTEENILNQATISVLSQANDMPQQILSLLTSG